MLKLQEKTKKNYYFSFFTVVLSFEFLALT